MNGSVMRYKTRMPVDATREQVMRLLADGAQLVEVLPSDEYVEEHIAGAINVPLKELPTLAGSLDPSKPVIVYCWDSL